MMERPRTQNRSLNIAIAVGGLLLLLCSSVLAYSFTGTEAFDPSNAKDDGGIVSATNDVSEHFSIELSGTAMTEQNGHGNAEDTWMLSMIASHTPEPDHRWEVFFIRDLNGHVGTVNYTADEGGFYTAYGQVYARRIWLQDPDGDTTKISAETKLMNPEENGDFHLVGVIWDNKTLEDSNSITYSAFIRAVGNLACDRNDMGTYIDLKSPRVFSYPGYIDYHDDNYTGGPIKTWWIQP